jgi:hypothetical protein
LAPHDVEAVDFIDEGEVNENVGNRLFFSYFSPNGAGSRV